MDDLPEIQGPVNYLPDLTLWGIEEIDKGVCADTAINRRTIRANKARFQPVFTASGEPTDLIQVVTVEMQEAISRTNRLHIMERADDQNSDYLSGIDLLLADAEDHVPAWVLASTREWRRVKKIRDTEGNNYRPHLVGPPARCQAMKIDGVRCYNWTNGTVTYGDFCKSHAFNRPSQEQVGLSMRAKARARIESGALMAAEGLEELAQSATSEPVRLDAYKTLLNIAGIRPGMEIDVKGEVEVIEARSIVADRLLALREAAEKDKRDREEAEEAARLELEARTVEAEVIDGE